MPWMRLVPWAAGMGLRSEQRESSSRARCSRQARPLPWSRSPPPGWLCPPSQDAFRARGGQSGAGPWVPPFLPAAPHGWQTPSRPACWGPVWPGRHLCASPFATLDADCSVSSAEGSSFVNFGALGERGSLKPLNANNPPLSLTPQALPMGSRQETLARAPLIVSRTSSQPLRALAPPRAGVPSHRCHHFSHHHPVSVIVLACQSISPKAVCPSATPADSADRGSPAGEADATGF